MQSLSRKLSTINHKLFCKAKKYLVGGVNSPVRSFKAVGGYPVFVREAKGSKIYSECGREFIDFCMGYGALILGHSNPKVIEEIKKFLDKGINVGIPTKLEMELAKTIIKAIPSIEKIRLTNSGTEAVMGAIRLARAYTKKDKIIKFSGSYHGSADYLLDCEGVPKDFKKNTITCPYNDVERVQELVEKNKERLAAIIVEPICGNMGVVLPKEGFLETLREICDRYKIVLIFDEVITGFRLNYGSAQEYFKIKADLTCLGKIIGGGLPCGAFGGKKEIMELLAPEGSVYQGGTFSGNPITISAGLATLKILSEENPYKKLENITRYLCENIIKLAKNYGIKLKINFIGSMFSIFFIDKKEVRDYNIVKTQDTNFFKRFHHELLKEGIYFSPSAFETNFLSCAHTEKDLEITLEGIKKTFDKLRGK
ncbi:MAG: glutamate-1-semialdehyde 2,1-aminomutase [Candidatus Omnitrophica bacterium]|nr:glutamate-1-semialdehyde 2,1-aminomutase [Candidatus Omnitrophota bacterium]